LRKLLTYIWPVVLLGVVIGAATGTYYLIQRDLRSLPSNAQTLPATVPATILVGHDYYLWIRLIELLPKRLDGEPWDTGGSGPDIHFSLIWKDNTIYASDKRTDTLIAKWDLLSADVFDLVKTRKIDLESAIRMPIVHVDAGTVVQLNISDSDLTKDDQAGSIEIHPDTLLPGVNVLTGPSGSAIARVEVQAIDARIALPDLVDLVSKR